MDKCILIISGGIEAAEAARRAKQMGLFVVVSDRDARAPGFAFADSCLLADVYGPEETATAAERFNRKVRRIDGVICVAADAPLTTALVAERLGLPGIDGKSARLACDKMAMKRCFAAQGVPVPWFKEVATLQELQRIVIERGPDLVIKPVDSRGSRGVQRLARVADFSQAFLFARAHSPSQRVMVEEYLSGPQISTESLICDGCTFTSGLSDRNYEYLDRFAPYFVENGGDLPSQLPIVQQAKVKDVVHRAAAALGIRNGTVKGDIVVHQGEPYVIELAARLSGGFFCTREIPLNTGVDFVGCALRLALGETITAKDAEPKYLIPVVQRYAFPPPGRIVSIEGADEARAVAGVEDVVITARTGDIIASAGDKRPSAAMVLAKGSSREHALKAANDALACLRIQTQ